jgi:hypothetical protein
VVRASLVKVRSWFNEFFRLVREWWGTMAGWISIPFAFAALFNIPQRLLFAALAYVSLWARVISQARQISQLQRPPSHKLMVSPRCRMKPDDPSSVIVDLSLSNVGTPPAELHNLIGQFWTDQRFILRESTQPKVYYQSTKAGGAIFAYYDLSVHMLHDSTTEPITQSTFRVPNQGEFIPIGVQIRSSETPWQTEMWKVVRHGENARIIDAQNSEALAASHAS